MWKSDPPENSVQKSAFDREFQLLWRSTNPDSRCARHIDSSERSDPPTKLEQAPINSRDWFNQEPYVVDGRHSRPSARERCCGLCPQWRGKAAWFGRKLSASFFPWESSACERIGRRCYLALRAQHRLRVAHMGGEGKRCPRKDHCEDPQGRDRMELLASWWSWCN